MQESWPLGNCSSRCRPHSCDFRCHHSRRSMRMAVGVPALLSLLLILGMNHSPLGSPRLLRSLLSSDPDRLSSAPLFPRTTRSRTIAIEGQFTLPSNGGLTNPFLTLPMISAPASGVSKCLRIWKRVFADVITLSILG